MSLNSRRDAQLAAMGVVRWMPRAGAAPGYELSVDPVQSPEQSRPPPMPAPPLEAAQDATHSLEALRVQVAACTRCELHRSRTNTVFGVGNARARLLLVGEAPGADEDARGEPFVGRAGRLLDAMLLAIGLEREQVYIANILKCRPPGNRDPKPEEVVHCAGYLDRQIASIGPELILALGRVAAQNLLGVATPVARLRGREHHHPSSATPVLVTYHPAYLLRSPLEKRRAWEDLARVAARLGSDP